jgi:hypothetical protein
MGAKEEWLKAVLPKTKDFDGIPTYSPFGDGEWFYTAKSMSWEGAGTAYSDVHVPIGFVTDLTSVPSPFWAVLPRDGRYLPAAIVHDYLYWIQDRPRATADKILRIGMTQLRVSFWQRAAIFAGINLGGEWAWTTNATRKATGERRVLRRFPQDPKVTWEAWRKEDDVFAPEDIFLRPDGVAMRGVEARA